MKHIVGRVGRGVAGALLVLIGIILVPLPGPGFLVIFAGLLILARDYPWADRLVNRARARARAEQTARSVRRYLKPKQSDRSESTSDPVMNGDRS